jgi:hypothetical protein
VSLDDAGDFEALSYFWGSEEDKGLITLEKMDFPVTRNLFNALTNLRVVGSNGEGPRTLSRIVSESRHVTE